MSRLCCCGVSSLVCVYLSVPLLVTTANTSVSVILF